MQYRLLLALLACYFSTVVADSRPAVCIGMLFGITTDSALRSNRCVATVRYLVDQASRNPTYPNISWGMHTDNEMIDTHGFSFRAALLSLKQSMTPCSNGAPLSVMIGPAIDADTISSANVLGPLGVTSISPMSRSPKASDVRFFPRAFRTSSNFRHEISAIWSFIRMNDWHKVAVVYTQTETGAMIANQIPTLAQAVDYPLDELEQAISPTDQGDGCMRAMSNLRDLRYRIIVIHAEEQMAKLIISTMGKLDMLNGDFIVIGTSYWTSSPTGETEVAFNQDEKALLKGTFGLRFRRPSSTAWTDFLGNMTAIAPDYFYPTHTDLVSTPVKNTHDATTMVINAVVALARAGKAINEEMMFQAISAARSFTGIDGPVSFDANGDAPADLAFTNFQNGAYERIGAYAPTSEIVGAEAVLTLETLVQWPDGQIDGTQSDQVPKHLQKVPSWAINLGYAMMAIGIIFNLVLHRLIWQERAHEVIKASSPMFCHLIVAGSAFTYLLPGLGSIDAAVLCRALPGCVAAAFSIIFGCLFAKTWRIHRIFNSRTLTRKAPSNKNLLVVVAILLGFEAFIQIIWMSIDLPQADIVGHPTNDFASVEVCTANHMDVWWAMSLLPKIIAILFGLFFAYKVRKLNHNFNEAKYISLAVYNVLFISILLLPLALLFETNPVASYVVRTLGPMIGAMITLGLLFVPKFWDMYITHDWVEYVSDAIYENGVLVHKSSKHSNGSRNGHNSNGSINKDEKPNTSKSQPQSPNASFKAARGNNYMARNDSGKSRQQVQTRNAPKENTSLNRGTGTPSLARSPTPDTASLQMAVQLRAATPLSSKLEIGTPTGATDAMFGETNGEKEGKSQVEGMP